MVSGCRAYPFGFLALSVSQLACEVPGATLPLCSLPGVYKPVRVDWQFPAAVHNCLGMWSMQSGIFCSSGCSLSPVLEYLSFGCSAPLLALLWRSVVLPLHRGYHTLRNTESLAAFSCFLTNPENPLPYSYILSRKMFLSELYLLHSIISGLAVGYMLCYSHSFFFILSLFSPFYGN